MLKDLVLKNRSYRKFFQNIPISSDILAELIDLARLTPSARNMQPLKYIISANADTNEDIFQTLTWAVYLKDWPGPNEGEKPSAYIVILGDTSITNNYFCDPGIVAQTILLGAVEKGYGGCIFGSINRKKLIKNLTIEAKYEVLYVIALGKPNESIILEEIGKDGDIKYWRDKKQGHHVPKRTLNDIIIKGIY